MTMGILLEWDLVKTRLEQDPLHILNMAIGPVSHWFPLGRVPNGYLWSRSQNQSGPDAEHFAQIRNFPTISLAGLEGAII